MPRFFVDFSGEVSDKVVLSDQNARHISYSLRAKCGELFTLCGNDGHEYNCKIDEITRDTVTCTVLEKVLNGNEPNIRVKLYQALTKSDKFDIIIQKATELGVYEIVPVLSERCVSRPDSKSFENKLERWKKIAKSASMQCNRSHVPEIRGLLDFKTAVKEISHAECGFLCYENENTASLKSLFAEKSSKKPIESLSFLIGPEGGISKSEAEFAASSGVSAVTLGKRILRTETAPLVVISAIMFYFDEMEK